MRPIRSLVANLVHSTNSADANDVMVGRQGLMRRREPQTLDEGHILYEAKRHAQADGASGDAPGAQVLELRAQGEQPFTNMP
jgi:hypothetical protein